MKIKFQILIVFAAIFWTVYSAPSSTGNEQINQNLSFNWEIESEGQQEYITFKVTANAQGWVGIGIPEQTSNSMPGADYIVFVYNNGSPQIYDMFSRQFAQPTEDQCNSDWTLLDSKQNSDGTLYFEVKRLLNTTDNQDRPIIKDKMRLLWAFGDDSELSIHAQGKVGVASVDFSNSQATDQTQNSGEETFQREFLMNAVIGHEDETNYMLRSFKRPADITDGSMIQFEFIEDTGPSQQMLHHLLFYGCTYDTTNPQNGAAQSQIGAVPGQSQLGNPEGGCTELFYTWALGANPLIMPNGVGFNVGKDTDSLWTHYLIEFHYHNQNLEQNVVDNSGVRITYSKVRRPIEAAILQVGDPLVASDPLPFGQQQIIYQKSCKDNCSSKFDHDINVFAETPHMHQAGRRIITNQYRGDQLISTTTQVDFYQFDNQQIISVDYVFKKGDVYHVYCVYDTTSVNKDIEFGNGSKDEMCMNFIYYYPALQNPVSKKINKYCGSFFAGSVCGEEPGQDTIFMDDMNPGTLISLDSINKSKVQFGSCTKYIVSSSNDDASGSKMWILIADIFLIIGFFLF